MITDNYTDLELKLRAECEQGFSVGPKCPSALEQTSTSHSRPDPGRAPTGERFVELTLMPPQKPLANDQEAYRIALQTFREYASDKTGTLYWRTYPEIERGRFYMRLLISDTIKDF